MLGNPSCFDKMLNSDILNNATTNTTLSDKAAPECILNQTVTTEGYIVKAPLLNTDFPLAITYIIVISVALLIGAFGNTMILVVATCYRGINRIGKEFIINLALADFCVSAIADPMCIVGVVKGKRYFDGVPWLCELVASMCLTACFCAFMSLTMLSLNRFVYVCHNHLYDKMYGKKMCIFFCVTCWVVGFLCEFPNFLGWGGHFFDHKSHQCIWDRTSSLTYNMFVSFGLIGGPLVMMSVFYLLIFKHIWQTKWNIYKMTDTLNSKKVWVEIAKTSRTLFAIFMVYLICWTPYAIMIIIDIEDRLSVEVHLFVTLLAHLHSSANCIIFLICNRDFRRNVLQLCGYRWSVSSHSEVLSKSSVQSNDTKSDSLTIDKNDKKGYTFTNNITANYAHASGKFEAYTITEKL